MSNLTLYNLLFSAQITGLLWCVLLFALCFFCVHVAKLAKVGYQKTKELPKKEEEKKEEKPPAPKEPVYYIVERKRRKPSGNYSEPKKITFK